MEDRGKRDDSASSPQAAFVQFDEMEADRQAHVAKDNLF